MTESSQHSYNLFTRYCLSGAACLVSLLLTQCASSGGGATPAQGTNVVVSVKEQKLAIYTGSGSKARVYPVSTSKFGLGDRPGTGQTPLGLHEVVAKIGHGAPKGAVFKSRRPTGEVIKPDAPGRDPIVSRIMWLRGMERGNANAYGRCIYIHGTAEERNIGKPVSYGCVRMKSNDVVDLFQKMNIGSRVLIVEGRLPNQVHLPTPAPVPQRNPATAPPIFLNPEQQPGQPPAPTHGIPLEGPANHPPVQGGVLAQAPREPVPNAIGSGFASKKMENGSTVIYHAQQPEQKKGGRIVLKSKRHASDNIR